jgi:hypothetical protein
VKRGDKVKEESDCKSRKNKGEESKKKKVGKSED